VREIWEWYKARSRVVQILIALGVVFVLIALIPSPPDQQPASEPQADRQATKEAAREVTVNEGLDKAEEQALQQDLNTARQDAAELETQNSELEAQVADLQARVDELQANQSQGQEAIQQEPSGSGTKHVSVRVSSNIPVDVLIMDDNFDANVSEQITGRQTYEFDIAKNSGFLAEASNLDRSGNIHVAVYEDGKLVAEDSDPSYAQITY
jgi:septal ring factor EnvC (AmiA/AmiB activator)